MSSQSSNRMLLSAQGLVNLSYTPEPLTHASSLSSVVTAEDDDRTARMRKEDSGVFLCASSIESDLNQLSWTVGDTKRLRGGDELRPGMYNLRGRRHSCTPVTPMPVIHDGEVIQSTRRSSLGDVLLNESTSQSRRCSVHSVTSTGSAPQGSAEKANLPTGGRRCSVHSVTSGSSVQSQLPTIIDSEVLPPQPVGQWKSVMFPAPPPGRFRRRSGGFAPRPAQMSVITNGDIYCSLPCRSHHKPLNVHSKLMCQQQQKKKSNCECDDGNGAESPCIAISPIMQLYMESSNPVLQDYIKQIVRLNSDEADSCECSRRNSISSFSFAPAQPAQSTHAFVNPTSDNELEEGRPLKPTVEQECTALRRRAAKDVIIAVLRNLTCYLLLVAAVLIIVQGGVSFYEGPLWRSIVPLVLLGIGVIGLMLQVKHVLQECRQPSHRTLIAQMLAARTKYHSAFIRMIHAQLTCAPYVAIEIHKKHRVQVRVSHNSKVKDVEEGIEGKHWSRVSKTISKMLSYTSWGDRSENIEQRDWDHERCNWIIVAKDYRAANSETEASLQKDIMDFSRDSFFDEAHPHGMKSRLVLDVMEGEGFPDVQAYLVCPDHGKSRFYTFHMYKVMLYMGLDALYCIAFHIATRHIGQYNITKVINRHCDKPLQQESES